MKPPLTGWPVCPVNGHNHAVRHVRELTNVAGEKADLFECPGGNYRWFVLKGRMLSDVTRMVKPRFGWRNPTNWRNK
jgi:hypothetical protein